MGGLIFDFELVRTPSSRRWRLHETPYAGVLPYFVPVGGFMLTPRYKSMIVVFVLATMLVLAFVLMCMIMFVLMSHEPFMSCE